MNLKDMRYVFTITDGGFYKHHDLYAITKDNQVLYTNMFTDIESANPKYLFNLRDKLDFERCSNYLGFDAPTCVMYKVKHPILGEPYLKKLYAVGMYNNTPAVDTVLQLANEECNNIPDYNS